MNLRFCPLLYKLRKCQKAEFLTLHHMCLSGIPFMQVEAVDRDDRNTAHAELRFSLMEQTPRIPSSQMFFIDSITGEVSLTDDGQFHKLSVINLHFVPKDKVSYIFSTVVMQGLLQRSTDTRTHVFIQTPFSHTFKMFSCFQCH